MFASQGRNLLENVNVSCGRFHTRSELPFTSEVNIHDIKRISKRKSLLATPALAVDRLVLHYGTYNEIQISPKDESKFINLLLTKNPQIKIDE